MARVTLQGLEPTSLEGYLDALRGAFRDALGNDLNLAPETPQGQLIGALALTLSEVDEALVAVSNGFSVSRSLGVQLDDLGSLLGIPRRPGTRSSVTVTIAGQSGTAITAGSRARTSAGDLFELVEDVTIPSSGSVTAAMRSAEEGPIPAEAGALSEIFDLVGGWESVTNSAPAALGRHVESDDDFRARYAQSTTRNARASVDAIRAAVLDVDGVAEAIIRENAANAAVTVQGKIIDAHSVCVVVEGGADAEVAAAIARSKPAGAGTSGDTSVEVPHAGGWTVPIALSRTSAVPIRVTMALTLDKAFPSDGTGRIIGKVLGHVRGLSIAEPLTAQRFLVDLLAVPGHTVDLGVGRKGGTVITGTGTVADMDTFRGRATEVTGTGTVAALATLQGITSGTVTFLGQTVTGLDFSGDSDLDGVASTLQAALRATNASGLANVEVTYDSTASAFVITIPLDSNGSATSVSAAFTGSESDELGLDTATIVNGVDAITSGTLTLHGATASGIDFSNVSSHGGVASVLQTALRATSEADLDQVEVSYADGTFVITVPLSGDGAPVTVTGGVSGATAEELGLDSIEVVQGSVTSDAYLNLNERLSIVPNDISITVS